MNPNTMTTEQADEILAQWDLDKSVVARQAMACCPHCDGDGEEPGAPMDDEGIYPCSLCDGQRQVPAQVASALQVEQDETP